MGQGPLLIRHRHRAQNRDDDSESYLPTVAMVKRSLKRRPSAPDNEKLGGEAGSTLLYSFGK